MSDDYCIENDMPRQKELIEIELEKNILKANALIEELKTLNALKELLVEIKQSNVKIPTALLSRIDELCA